MNPPPNRRGAWYRYVDAAPMICVSSGRPLNSCWYMDRSGPLYELVKGDQEVESDNWWHQGTIPTEHRHLFMNDLWEVKQ